MPGWSRAGRLNSSLLENSCVNGGRRWADSASRSWRNDCQVVRRLTHSGESECVCVFMATSMCMGECLCLHYVLLSLGVCTGIV